MKIKETSFFAESWSVAFRKLTANILYEDLVSEFESALSDDIESAIGEIQC